MVEQRTENPRVVGSIPTLGIFYCQLTSTYLYIFKRKVLNLRAFFIVLISKWKEANKTGFDCTVDFKVEDNKITTTTVNCGISIKVVTTIYEPPEEVYFSLTGDQCAITNIRIGKTDVEK